MRSAGPKRNPRSCFRHQVSQSAEVVSSPGESKQPPNLVDPSQLHFPEHPDHFHPPERLFPCTAAHVPAPVEKTTRRSPRSANAPDSCCTPRDSTPPRPSPSPQTTGTACCTGVARSACAHCAPNRKPATAVTSTVAPGQSTDAPHRSTASRTSATSPSESRPPSCGSVATDDPREHASLEKCS